MGTPQIVVLRPPTLPIVFTAIPQEIALRPYGLKNGEGVGILLDEIVVSGVQVIDPASGATSIPTGATFIRMRKNGVPLTNGYTDIRVLYSRWNDNGSGQACRLPKPIYMAPGDTLDIELRNDNLLTAEPATVVGIGHECPVPPTERYLPYFASYNGTRRGVAAAYADFYEASTPQDLGNPFPVPLTVDRLVGGPTPGSNPTASPAWWYVRIADDEGNYWIPAPTHMAIAFNAVDRIWPVHGFDLRPSGFLRVEQEANVAVATAAGATTWAVPGVQGTDFLYPYVGLVGYHRI